LTFPHQTIHTPTPTPTHPLHPPTLPSQPQEKIGKVKKTQKEKKKKIHAFVRELKRHTKENIPLWLMMSAAGTVQFG
jgi:hypothetical protein